MEDLITTIEEFFKTQQTMSVVQAILILIAGFVLASLLSRLLVRATEKSLDAHRLMLLRRGTYYTILAVFIISAMMQLGFDLGILLGTAGILTIALAFAAQTSTSNFISGLFLLSEGPFQVGDLIRVGTTEGVVLEVGLLSVKLRKFDNTFIRVPNELLIQSEVSTLTKFPIRRLDLKIGVDYNEDIGKVRQVLNEVADKNPLSLEEPAPLFVFQGFGDSAQQIQFSVWVQRENYLDVKNSIQEEIKEAFDEAGISISFPQRTLHLANTDRPVPVQVVSNSELSTGG